MTITFKHLNQAGYVPQAADLEEYEVAINVADGSIYTKEANRVQLLGISNFAGEALIDQVQSITLDLGDKLNIKDFEDAIAALGGGDAASITVDTTSLPLTTASTVQNAIGQIDQRDVAIQGRLATLEAAPAPDLSGLVDLTTAQSIDGDKTFVKPVVVPNAVATNQAVALGQLSTVINATVDPKLVDTGITVDPSAFSTISATDVHNALGQIDQILSQPPAPTGPDITSGAADPDPATGAVGDIYFKY